MKQVISTTNNKYLEIINKSTNIPVLNKEFNLSNELIPYHYNKIYSKLLNDLNSGSSIIIKIPNSIDNDNYEVLINYLRSKDYKFSNIIYSSKFNLMSKLNPRISIFLKIKILINYYLKLIKNINLISNYKVIFNNTLISKKDILNRLDNNYQYKFINKVGNYKDIIFIYEKYNPDCWVDYIHMKSMNINLDVLKF